MDSMKQYASPDEYYMARCLTLAERGRATVSPNPMVGAVVLDAQGRKIAEGWHQKAGEPHAEVIALDQAGEAAKGGTLYVSLEPCCHTGKTPPCTERVLASGVKRVVCGTLDPNPLVAGQGVTALQGEGLNVVCGYLEEECRRLNETFFHHIQTKRPFVTLKLAMTMDGKIAARNGKSQWLTGPMARQYVHYLRSGYDAILTTSETVMADNPQLTVREGFASPLRTPTRIVLDRQFRLNLEKYQVFETQTAPTWLMVGKRHHHGDRVMTALSKKLEVLPVHETGLGMDLSDVLIRLGEKGVTSVFVEAGGRLAGSLLSAGLVNKLVLFYAPKVLHDAMARSGFTGAVNLGLDAAPKLQITDTRQLDQDWVVTAYPDTRT